MQQAKFRFGFYNSYNAFSWSLVLNNKGKDLSRWFGPQSRDSGTPWNQTSAKGSVKYNEDIYLVIIIDPNNKSQKSGEIFDGTEFSSKDCIKQDIYLNDDKLIDGWLNKDLWDTSLVENLDTLNKFCLGRCSMSRSGEWCYSHMSAYSLRFYNRALTDDEINANREKTIEYHKILESQNSEKAE